MQGSWRVYLTIAIVVVLIMLAFVLFVGHGPDSGHDDVRGIVNTWL
jgi:hypothetical protein